MPYSIATEIVVTTIHLWTLEWQIRNKKTAMLALINRLVII